MPAGSELECNPACQMMQVYLLPGLLSPSRRALPFLSFGCDGEVFIFNSLKTKSVKIVNGARKLWPGCINPCVQCSETVHTCFLEKQ